jgi:hypothetical protein
MFPLWAKLVDLTVDLNKHQHLTHLSSSSTIFSRLHRYSTKTPAIRIRKNPFCERLFGFRETSAIVPPPISKAKVGSCGGGLLLSATYFSYDQTYCLASRLVFDSFVIRFLVALKLAPFLLK